MNDEILLDIKDLYVEYATDREVVHAVNGVSLSIRRGETLGLVGETGAGKTTTALSIMRLLPPRTGRVISGSIALGDMDILHIDESEMRSLRGRRVAMVYQDPMTSLNPVVTVGNQILEVLELHKKESAAIMRARVGALLEMVGIPADRQSEYPHQFSGGMKQRVVIAMALACEPELLIADEPTTALDVTIQAQVLKMIDELKRDLNTSMLLITHDLGIVAQTCDNIAIMYAGKIIEWGTLNDIFNADVRHPYTTGLFNSIPRLDQDTERLQPIEGMIPDPTALPKGCSFHPRCSFCMEICRTIPPDVYAEGSHNILCHLYTDMEGVNDV